MASKLSFVSFKNLPELGVPGHLYLVRDSPRGTELLLASRTGQLCPVTEFFHIQIAEATGKDGRDGVDGKDGAPGKDGADGKPGDKGEPGDVLYVGPVEIAAAMQKLRDQKAHVIASLRNKIATVGNHPAGKLAQIHLRDVQRKLEEN